MFLIKFLLFIKKISGYSRMHNMELYQQAIKLLGSSYTVFRIIGLHMQDIDDNMDNITSDFYKCLLLSNKMPQVMA